VNSDASNCGACGNACPARANASSACSSATCGYVCQVNFGDCNGVSGDGCEVNTASNVANCGRCGNPCPTPANGTATCAGGACGVACNTNFANCNNNATDGCEVNLTNNTSNCGACGRVCASNQTCTAGACVNNAPSSCQGGTDTLSGLQWIVCTADSSRAWISHNSSGGGRYRATQICQSLGYSRLGRFGGNCNSVCGYCAGSTSCTSRGPETYDGGGTSCGTDSTGQILCNTVMWECLR
jgi:hypothetical protein